MFIVLNFEYFTCANHETGGDDYIIGPKLTRRSEA